METGTASVALWRTKSTVKKTRQQHIIIRRERQKWEIENNITVSNAHAHAHAQ